MICNNKGVYALRCRATDKIYIGSSNQLEESRLQHFRFFRIGKHHTKIMQADYDKFGEGVWEWLVLKHGECMLQMRALEPIVYNRLYEIGLSYNYIRGPQKTKYKFNKQEAVECFRVLFPGNQAIVSDLTGKLPHE